MPAPMTTRRLLCSLPCLPVLALASCGGASGPDFPPPCPKVAILHDAADLNRFAGSGQDLTQMVLGGRITGLSGTCTRAQGDNVLTAVTVALDLTRGPAAPSRQAAAAYFVALVDGQTILAKRVYPIEGRFPPNTDRLTVAAKPVEVLVPNSPTKSAAAYQLLVGFVLTPAELQSNRTRGIR